MNMSDSVSVWSIGMIVSKLRKMITCLIGDVANAHFAIVIMSMIAKWIVWSKPVVSPKSSAIGQMAQTIA